jgi:hypothetical protein
MDSNVLNIIKKQTNVNDDVEITKAYLESKENISDTILKLSEIQLPTQKETHRTIFDDMRMIFDEKAYIYQDYMNRNKTT